MVKKDIEIQPGFEPGSSEFRSDALTNELVELWLGAEEGRRRGQNLALTQHLLLVP